jgi:hypothetical protein
MAKSEARMYSLGERERGLLAAGITPVQGLWGLAWSLVALIWFAASHANSMIESVLCVVIGAVGAFMRPGGRAPVEWVPVIGRFYLRAADRQWRLGPQPITYRPEKVSRLDIEMPPPLEAVELLALNPAGNTMGILADREAESWSLALLVRPSTFALADRETQDRQLGQWGSILATLGREGSAVRRIQWIERTLPADHDALLRYLRTAGVEGPATADYQQLIEGARRLAQEHQLILVVTVDKASGRKQLFRYGKRKLDDGAAYVLARETKLLVEQLRAAGIRVDGVLNPSWLLRTVRTTLDPWVNPQLARTEAMAGALPKDELPPSAFEENWGFVRCDGAYHATLWVSSWPRIGVAAPWLIPLVGHTQAVRTVSVVMEPIPSGVALREIERISHSEAEEEMRRAKVGRVTTAVDRRAREATARREVELAHGHTELRFSGYIDVCARNEEELELGVDRVEHSASQCYIGVRRMWGEQGAGLSYVLPLGRGLE